MLDFKNNYELRYFLARAFINVLNFEEIYRVIKYFQTPEEEKQLPRAFLELSFQKSLRKQNVKLLKGTLCRAEF